MKNAVKNLFLSYSNSKVYIKFSFVRTRTNLSLILSGFLTILKETYQRALLPLVAPMFFDNSKILLKTLPKVEPYFYQQTNLFLVVYH